MLTAHKIPRACHSCRLQLLTIFEHGFTKPVANSASRSRYTTSTHIKHRNHIKSQSTRARTFSTTRFRQDEAREDVSAIRGATVEEIEAVVREARQTFGETLPKDYLSVEEYALYERLYGPPIRETKAEDLLYLPGTEDPEPPQHQVRNVLLRENADGEFEEVEFDPELGFSVIEDFGQELIAVPELSEFDELIGQEVDRDIINELGSETAEEDINVIVTELAAEDMYGTETDILAGELGVIESDLPVAREGNVVLQGKNQREIDAIARLQKDMDAALAEAQPVEEEVEEVAHEEDIEEAYNEEADWEEVPDREDVEDDSGKHKIHPHTLRGRSGTDPSTIYLPRETFVEPITTLLARTDWKHLTKAAEDAFGGKGLPYSPSTPRSKTNLPQKHIGLDASQHRMSDIQADAYISAVMPGTYAMAVSTLVEVRKRLGKEWIRDLIFKQYSTGPRVLDANAGGAGAIAWRQMVQAEWDLLKEEGTVSGDHAPIGTTTVLSGADTLRHRLSRFLDDTSFLPRLPDYVNASTSEDLLHGSVQGRKSYDIIIASHTLFPLKEDYRRKQMVENLWSLLDPNGGVLIILEKGVPRGFEAIAGAREHLLERRIQSPGDAELEAELQSPGTKRFGKKEIGMIIAPCTNHKPCPMYPTPGLTFGRKDFCHFAQRYIRPPFLQRVLGATMRNHEDVKFSYLAVRRGLDARLDLKDPLVQDEAATERSFEGWEDDIGEFEPANSMFNALSLPRAILPPLKRRGHVTLDLCTPSGKLERWTVPKSFSHLAYHDARKSRWGDLWALGAKTRVPRTPRLGKLAAEEERPGSGKAIKTKGIRDGKMGKGGKKVKTNKFNVVIGKGGFEGIELDRDQSRRLPPMKRTKGGRIWKPRPPITEDDI
jgi:ribosomal protein RSM22 (predicted rRNA methylase)